MGKKKDKGAKIPKHIAGIKLPKDVRRKGEALIAQATSPAGQAVIAKGLTMAAGLATAAAARSQQARAARPLTPDESGEGGPSPAPAPAPATPVDPAKIVEAVTTVANVVLGRLFSKR